MQYFIPSSTYLLVSINYTFNIHWVIQKYLLSLCWVVEFVLGPGLAVIRFYGHGLPKLSEMLFIC
jgi:hypothetical protein